MRITFFIIAMFLCKITFCQFEGPIPTTPNWTQIPLPPPAPITSNYKYEIIKDGVCPILKDTSGTFYSENNFKSFWYRYFGTDIPKIDFENNMVVIIKRTISVGQDIVISGVIDGFKRLKIYTELSCPYNCRSYRDNNRYVLVILPTNSKPVKVF